MNDWLLDILIKPNLKKSDADKIAKQLAAAIKTELSASDLGTIKLDDKKLKSATSSVVTALNSSIRELSQNLKSFAQLMKTVQGQANQAAATTARGARSVRPVAQHDPGYPVRRPTRQSSGPAAAAFSVESSSTAGASKSKVNALKKKLEIESKRSIDEYGDILKILVDSPDQVVTILKSALPKIKAQASAGAQKVSKGLSENVTKIIDALRILQVDTGIVANLQAFRQPVKKLADRFRQENKGSPVVNKDFLNKQFSSKSFGGADDPGSGFKQLKSAIRSLAGVAKKPGAAPEVSVTSLLSEIGKLTSKSGAPGAVKASGEEFGKLQTKTNNIVRDTLRRISLKLEHETKKVGKRIEGLRLEGGKGSEKEIIRLSGTLDRKLNKHLEVLRAIDRGSDRFNINLARDTKGQTGRPGLRKEEAGFLAGGSLRAEQRKELDLDKAAVQAVKIAQAFKDIPDPIDRAQATFRAIWTQAKAGTGEMSKTIARVSETLKNTHVSGLVNRKEMQEVIGLLDRYRSQIEGFKAQTRGLGGARTSHAVIPKAFDIAEEGGTNREYLKAVARIRNQIANDPSIKKGVSIPINIPVETAGGIRNINVEFKKLGSSMDRIIPKAKQMNRALSLKDSVATAFRRVTLWGAAAGITYGAVNAFRQAGRTMLEVETGVINLSKVVRSADSDLEAFGRRAEESAKRIAIAYGTSMQEVFKSMRIFAQQGLEMVEVIQLTEATSIAANTTVLDQAKAAEGLTSAIKQFGLEASASMQIVDAWNEVAKRNAVTELTLVDALKKAGSAARTVGVDFNQLIGLTTAVGEATRQPGKEVGTSLRFIFQRALRPESAKVLSKIGVATKDLEGNFRGFMAIIGDLAGMWEGLAKGQQLAVAQALGGARQYNAVVALMNNYATAVKASEDALNSQGSAQLENTKVMGTTTKIFAQTKASIDSLSVSMGKIFLPLAQDLAKAGKSIIDVFASMPTTFSKVAGGLALATVGFSRFAQQADMVLAGSAGVGGAAGAGGAGGGIIAGVGAGLVGRGKAGIDPLSNRGTQLGEFGIAAVGLSDFSRGAVSGLSGLEGKIVDINGKAVQGSERFSKMGLAIRRMGYEAGATGEKTRVGFKHMNSPLSKLLLLFGLLGKQVLGLGAGIVNAAARGVGAIRGLTAATIQQAAAARTAAVANAGWAASLGGLVVGTAAVIGGYYLVKYLYDVATAQRKTGEQTQKDLRSELSKRQEVMRSLQAQQSLVTSLSSKREAIKKAEAKQAGGGSLSRGQPSAEFRRYKLELQSVKTGTSASIVDPSAIERFDKFGNVVLKVGESFRNMSKYALEAQAHMIALTRLKVAKSFAGDILLATSKLDILKDRLKGINKIAKIEESGLGRVGRGTGTIFSNLSRNAGKQTAKINQLVSNMLTQIKALPKETALFSLQEFAESENIMSALEISIRENNSAFAAMGKPIATAEDKLIQLSLAVKGFKGIGLKVFETKDLYRQQNIASTSLEQVIDAYDKTKKRLKGGELVLIDGENPLGLTQASTAIDRSGRLVVEGLNKSGKTVRIAFNKFIKSVGDPKKVQFLDPAVMTRQISESVLKVQRKLSGAGTGLIDFGGKLDLGVNFDFQLGEVDRLQKAGKASSKAIVAAYLAQKQYNASLADFKKAGKDNAKAQLSESAAAQLNVQRATVSATLHMVKFISVIESLGNSFAKAAHELNKAAIVDRVESQFGAVYGTIAGFSDKLTIKLPKTIDELSPDERFSQANPELAVGIRSSQRVMEKLKSQIVAMEQLSGGDIQKMFEAFTNQDKKIFTSAMESLGGDLKGATIVTHLNSIAQINKHGFSRLITAITKEPDKKDPKKAGLLAAGTTVDSMIGALVDLVDSNRTLSKTFLTKDQGKAATSKRNLALASLGFDAKPPKTELSALDKLKAAKAERESSIKKRVGIADLLKEAVKTNLEGGKPLDLDRLIREVARKGSSLAITRANEAQSGVGPTAALAAKGQPEFSFLSLLAPGAKLPSAEDILRIVARQRLEGFSQSLGSVSKTGPGTTSQQKELYTAIKNIILFARKRAKEGVGLEDPGRRSIGSSGLVIAQKARSAVFREAQDRLAKSLAKVKDRTKNFNKQVLGLATSLGFVGKRVQSFLYDISKGVDRIRTGRDVDRLTRDVSSPIAGQLRGVSVGQINLGKLKGELSPVERVAKQFSSYFTNIAEQEKSRTGAIGLFATASAQLLKVRKDVTGLLTGGAKLSNREGLLKLQAKAETLYKRMANEMVRVNNRMSPFIESLTKMVRLEAAKKSIDDIVKALKKAEDLQFDSTSIDTALGRHPLSKVAPQFGQPAGLDKFQQQLFQLQQKSRAGTITGQDLSFEQKKVAFQREEALIQYKQGKENAKLTSETESARRAMGVLWDAQSQGIGGVEGLIQTLKTQLESAGDSTVGRDGVREFQGVPGLFGISKELSRVQAAVKEKNFKQQRDIVMAPLEALQAKANKLQAETKDEIAGQAAAIAQAVSGGKTKDLGKAALAAFNDIRKKTQKEFNSSVQGMSETMLRAQETISTGTDEHVPKLINNLVSLTKSVKDAEEGLLQFNNRVHGIPTTVQKGAKISGSVPGSPLATPQNKALGGIITGPGGIDTIPARLTRGEYVMPKGIVDKYGAGFFDNIRKGNAPGYALGGGVGRIATQVGDVGELFGISSIITGGKDHAGLSGYGALGKKLKDFIDGIKAGLRGPASGGLTPAYIAKALKDAGMEQLVSISGFSDAIAAYVARLTTKGGYIALSKPGSGGSVKVGDSFVVPGGGGGGRRTGGFSPFDSSNFSGRKKKTKSGGYFDNVQFYTAGKLFDSQQEIDEYFKINTTEALDAFGPSPGKIRDRFGPGPTGYASGGKVSGPSGIDVIPARLTKGEYVLPKRVVDRYGTSFFDAIKSGNITGFVDGGSVGGQSVNFDTRRTKAEKLIGAIHFPLLEAAGAATKFSDALSFFITSVANKAKQLKEAGAGYVVGGPVKTSRLPLALAEAGNKESKPDYVRRHEQATDFLKSFSKPRVSAEEREFAENFKSTPNYNPPGVKTSRLAPSPEPTGPGSGMYSTAPTGPGSGMYAITITRTKDLATSFAAVNTVVKDTVTTFGDVTTKVKDFTLTTTNGSKGQRGGGQLKFLGGQVSPVPEALSKLSVLTSSLTSASVNPVGSPEFTQQEAERKASRLEHDRAAGAELFRRDPRTGGLPLPASLQSKDQRGGGGALDPSLVSKLPEAFQALITTLDKASRNLEDIIPSYADTTGKFVPDIAKAAPPSTGAAGPGARSESDKGLDKLADRVYNAILEGIRDTEIKLSPDSLKEMEAAIVRGAEAMTNAIAQAAPTLAGGNAGGSLGAAVRPELEQINGRLDALGERITIEKNTIETNLNERFNDVESRIISDVKGEFTPKIAHVEEQTDSVLAYVRRLESLVHSVNSRGADL